MYFSRWEFLARTIHHQSRLRGKPSPAHAAEGAQGQRGAAVPRATGADGGIRNGRAGGGLETSRLAFHWNVPILASLFVHLLPRLSRSL